MCELSMSNSYLYAPQIDVKMTWLENGVKRKWLKFGWLKSRTDQLCVEPQRASPQGGLTACFESMGSSDGPVWPLSSPPSHNICIFTHSLLSESQQKRLYLCTNFEFVHDFQSSYTQAERGYDWKTLYPFLRCRCINVAKAWLCWSREYYGHWFAS